MKAVIVLLILPFLSSNRGMVSTIFQVELFFKVHKRWQTGFSQDFGESFFDNLLMEMEKIGDENSIENMFTRSVF